MRILVAHNRYQQRGGEDAVVEQEIALLRGAGLGVETLIVDNDGIVGASASLKVAAGAAYSWSMRARAAELIRAFSPDILHVHNTFPRLTPSIYDAAIEAGCPIVQTIHNFRLLCLNGTLFRDGSVCTQCLDRPVAWPGVAHRCYRDSFAGSASVAWMLAVNHWRGAWSRKVDRFLVLTPFAQELLLAHTDIPAEKMRVKANAAPDPGFGPDYDPGRGADEPGYALYAGRLAPEKGIATLIEAARLGLGLPLRVAGTGPMRAEVVAAADAGLLEYLGARPPDSLRELMKQATMLVVPSLWYEGLPMVIAEAFGAGLPVVASRIGSLATLVEHEKTGLLFAAGDADALAGACRRLAEAPVLRSRMRSAARAQYLDCYRPETNLARLLATYQELIEARSLLGER